MAMGGAAGTLASSICYPLDTIRRRMQMVGRVYDGQVDAFATIWREVGRLESEADTNVHFFLVLTLGRPLQPQDSSLISTLPVAAAKSTLCGTAACLASRAVAGGRSRVLQRLGCERIEGRAVQRHPLCHV